MNDDVPPATDNTVPDVSCSNGVPLYETVPVKVCWPLFEIVMETEDNVPVVPFFMMRIEAGATAIVATLPVALPVPDNATNDGLPVALCTIVSVSLYCTARAGVNVMMILSLA